MKKIIAFLILCLGLSTISFSQVATLDLKSKYNFNYVGVATDVLVDSLATITKVFYVDASKPYTAVVNLDIDKINTGASSSWAIYGSYNGTTLESLGTGSTDTWTGTADTIMSLKSGYSTYTNTSLDSDTLSTTSTIRYTLPLDYPYLIVKGTNSTSKDSELQQVNVFIREFEKPE
jgi:hypothetical protein